jgi:hypothetical protein
MSASEVIAPSDVPPIEASEWLLRRIAAVYYPDPDRPNKPQWLAFKPTSKDTDGLSLGRHRFIVDLRAYCSAAGKTHQRLARLQASQVESIRLSLRVTLGDPTHAIIPQLNIRDYESSPTQKKAIKEWARWLAHDLAEMVELTEA